MGIEINLDKLKRLNVQQEPTNVFAKQQDEVEIGSKLGGVVEGYADEANFSRKKSDDPKSAEKEVADKISKKLDDDNELRPATLKEYVEANVTNPELKNKANELINKIEAMKNPEQYLKEYKKAKNDPLYRGILEVYIEHEKDKATADFEEFYAKAAAKNNSYTEILNSYGAGWYFDSDNKIRNNPERMDSYKKDALYRFITEEMPYRMEKSFQAALLSMENEGTLQNYKTDVELAKAVVEKTGVNGSDPMLEQYVKNRKAVAKLTQRHDKIMKRRDELKHVSMTEINKKLKKETIASIKDYLEANKNDDGTYDLSEISVVIEKRIGKDYYVNRFDNENKTLWEVENIRRELRAPQYDSEGKEYHIVGNGSFDPEVGDSKQTKDLIDFCGYEFEPKNHVPSILEAAKGLAEGAIGGFLVHIAAPQRSRIHVEQNVIIRNILSAMTQEEITSMLGVSADAVSFEDANVIIQQIVDKNVLFDNVLPAIGCGALWGALAHAATDLIFGRGFDETECFNKSDYDIDESRYTVKEDYENYLKSIDNSGTVYKKVESLLKKYPAKADGTWDHAHFFNELRKMAGLGSNLNCLEMAGNEMYTEDKPEPTPAPEAQIKIITSKETIEVPDKTVTERLNENDLAGNNKITFNKKAKSSSWTHLAQNVYDCAPDGKSLADVFGLAKAIRILKIAQAITDGDYSREHLEKLYNLSVKGASNLKNIDGVDYNVYYSMLTKNFPQSIKLPKELAGIIRCDISNDERELEAPKASNQNGPKPATDPANGIKVTNKTIKGSKTTTYYVGKDKGGSVGYSSESEQQRQVNILKEAFPDIEVEDVENIDDFRKRAKEEQEEE